MRKSPKSGLRLIGRPARLQNAIANLIQFSESTINSPSNQVQGFFHISTPSPSKMTSKMAEIQLELINLS